MKAECLSKSMLTATVFYLTRLRLEQYESVMISLNESHF